MKILLYGIGQDLEKVENRIKKKHEIIGYTDSYATIKEYRGKRFFELKSISSLNFDYVVITIRNCKTAWDVRNMLSEKMNISTDKIIPFWNYADRELWNIKMRNCNLEEVRGLIFGNSFAAYGFLEKELFCPFVNLSVGSQDLYYEHLVFCALLEKYGKRLKRLEYIIIDLYDYIVFNIDVSFSTLYMHYIQEGGRVIDEHNFAKNKNFNGKLADEIFENTRIILKDEKSDKYKLMKQLFDNIDMEFDWEPNNRWKHIDKNELLPQRTIIGSTVLMRFEDTIRENVTILDRFLSEIRAWKHNIKIIFTLIPKYIAMEKVSEPFMAEWRKEFEKYVADMCKKYKVHFFNYKSCTEISGNHMFYYDTRHLNTIGARAMTAILNRDLEKL